jgi:hypothetical protein
VAAWVFKHGTARARPVIASIRGDRIWIGGKGIN